MINFGRTLSRFLGVPVRPSIAEMAELRVRIDQTEAFNKAYYLALGDQLEDCSKSDSLGIVLVALAKAHHTSAESYGNKASRRPIP